MEDKEILEIKGRLYLWHNAISECITILSLAKKSKDALSQKNIINDDKQYMKEYHDFLKTQDDYDQGSQKLSHWLKFQEKHKINFPSIVDCITIETNNIMLAIVFFSQIFNIGYGDEDKAKKNSKEFMNQHLDAILKIKFNEEEIINFHKLKDTILKIRNSMIGHADAKEFNIEHGNPITRMKIFSSKIKDIDLEFWLHCLEPLRLSILEYSNNLKI
jgi:hypothetical protein